MKPTELRLGNLVYCRDVDSITSICAHDLLDSETRPLEGWQMIYQPIPLTEEWLLKFGFHDCRMSSGLTEIMVKEFSTTTQGVFKGEYCVTLLGKIPHQLNHRIKYVHQLQNIFFALTGEELTLKEKAPIPA